MKSLIIKSTIDLFLVFLLITMVESLTSYREWAWALDDDDFLLTILLFTIGLLLRFRFIPHYVKNKKDKPQA